MFQTIDTLKQQGRHEEALAHALQQLPERKQDPQLLYRIASLHDVLGLEQQAIPFYQKAIEHHLSGADLFDAFLGLGSTLRALGRYQESLEIFDAALVISPQAKDINMFRAMTLYNLGDAKQAVAQLLLLLMETSSAEEITRYRRAIQQYARDLDRIG